MKQLDIACIIDDDELFTYILQKQMKLIRFCRSTLIFSNGRDALDYLRPIMESPDILPSVILLDLNMPTFDGWQFLEEFIRLKPHKKITIYILSSSIDRADHERALLYKDVRNFYIKPISQDDLQAMLNDVG